MIKFANSKLIIETLRKESIHGMSKMLINKFVFGSILPNSFLHLFLFHEDISPSPA